MITDKLIYQYGNADEPCYVFYKNQFAGTQSLGVKQQRADSAFIDGSVRLNGAEKAKRTSAVYEYEFPNMFFTAGSDDITSVFYSEPKVAFWFDVQDYDPTSPQLFRGVNKFYYAIADCVVTPTTKENEKNNRATPQQDYNISLLLDKPYIYDCTSAVQFVDTSAEVNISLWGATALPDVLIYGSGVWGSDQQAVLVSTLTQSQKDEYFLNVDAKDISKYLILKDRFFRLETTTDRNYVYNQTVTNTDTRALTSVFQASPVDNRIYRIEISQLSPARSLELNNLTNGSGLVITWLRPTSITDVVYNSYYDALYDSAGQKIPSQDYTVTQVGADMLYFSGLGGPVQFGRVRNESMRVTNTSSNPVTVKIDALIAY